MTSCRKLGVAVTSLVLPNAKLKRRGRAKRDQGAQGPAVRSKHRLSGWSAPTDAAG